MNNAKIVSLEKIISNLFARDLLLMGLNEYNMIQEIMYNTKIVSLKKRIEDLFLRDFSAMDENWYSHDYQVSS